MKNIILVILIFILSILAGCSLSTPVVKYNEPEPTLTATSEPIPEFIAGIMRDYATIFKNNQLPLKVQESVIIKNSFYKFKIESTDETKYRTFSRDVSFYIPSDNNPKRSYNVTFMNTDSNVIIKQFITATILFMNKGMSFEDAQNEMKKLVSSYSGSGHSNLYVAGNYTLFIIQDAFGNDDICVAYNDEINPQIDKSKFAVLSYDEIKAELNSGENVHIRGMVKKQYLTEYGETVEIVNGDKKYLAFYYFSHKPIIFEIGKTYNFYGTVSGVQKSEYACINMDYFEEE